MYYVLSVAARLMRGGLCGLAGRMMPLSDIRGPAWFSQICRVAGTQSPWLQAQPTHLHRHQLVTSQGPVSGAILRRRSKTNNASFERTLTDEWAEMDSGESGLWSLETR